MQTVMGLRQALRLHLEAFWKRNYLVVVGAVAVMLAAMVHYVWNCKLVCQPFRGHGQVLGFWLLQQAWWQLG
jgi:hypothetical protein